MTDDDAMRLDRIEIRDLLVRGIIGINPEERVAVQDIVINITIETDIRRCAETDDIAHTIDYHTVYTQVIGHVESAARLTVEALATDIARICCAHAGARRVRVRVEKPAALRFARSVGVEIERTPADFT